MVATSHYLSQSLYHTDCVWHVLFKHYNLYLHRQVQELSDQGVAMGQRQQVEHARRTLVMEEQVRKEKSKSRQLEMEMDSLKQ